MSVIHYISLLAVAAAVTVGLTPVVRSVGVKKGLVDTPGGRKVHTTAIPRIGGIAMFAGFASAIGVQALGERFLDWSGGLLTAGAPLLGMLVGCTIVFVIGLLDDLIHLDPGPKFAGQLAAAATVVVSGLRIDFIGNPFGGGLIALGLLSIPLTLVYFVGFANVINLIDGLDGLAAGVTAIAATSLLVLAAQANQTAAAVLAVALIGACVGFLRYNFNPASIFMGDSGSMLLGFVLAGISLLGVMKSVAAIALVVPLLIIGVPIFDTFSAIVRRIRHKRPIQEADEGHIHHRLLRRGFDQRQTVVIIYVWSTLLAAGAFAMSYAPTPIKAVAFVLLAILSAFMVSWLGLFEAAHHHGGTESRKKDV